MCPAPVGAPQRRGVRWPAVEYGDDMRRRVPDAHNQPALAAREGAAHAAGARAARGPERLLVGEERVHAVAGGRRAVGFEEKLGGGGAHGGGDAERLGEQHGVVHAFGAEAHAKERVVEQRLKRVEVLHHVPLERRAHLRARPPRVGRRARPARGRAAVRGEGRTEFLTTSRARSWFPATVTWSPPGPLALPVRLRSSTLGLSSPLHPARVE